MTYVPADVPPELTVEELADFIARELHAIAGAFLGIEHVLLAELHVAPNKLRDGMIILADGTNFNPGAGAGFYGRSAGAWVKLG